MIAGLSLTWAYIGYFKFWAPEMNVAENWFLGISPEGIGLIGMIANFSVAFAVARVTVPTPNEVKKLVDHIRVPTMRI